MARSAGTDGDRSRSADIIGTSSGVDRCDTTRRPVDCAVDATTRRPLDSAVDTRCGRSMGMGARPLDRAVDTTGGATGMGGPSDALGSATNATGIAAMGSNSAAASTVVAGSSADRGTNGSGGRRERHVGVVHMVGELMGITCNRMDGADDSGAHGAPHIGVVYMVGELMDTMDVCMVFELMDGDTAMDRDSSGSGTMGVV